MKNIFILLLLLISLFSNTFAQVQRTYIPDNNFEQALIDAGHDNVLDDYVYTDSIRYVFGLNLYDLGIVDFTGIQDFEDLEFFDCRLNNMTSLDLSANKKLYYVRCESNPNLQSINIKNGVNTNIPETDFLINLNPKLLCVQVDDVAWSTTNWTNKDITATYSENCGGSNAKTIICDDNFEQVLIDLGYDDIRDSYILTRNIDTITILQLNNKNISTLCGIEDFASLKYLSCDSNQLFRLDVSKNTALTTLNCSSNQINSLDVSKNLALKTLKCRKNKLTSLDLSFNTALVVFNGADNLLNSINIKNGNNTNITYFDVRNNNQYEVCIQVDDYEWAGTNWINKDIYAHFSEDCSVSIPRTIICDDNFEQALIDLGYDEIRDSYVFTRNIDTITILQLNNKNISTLCGIEGFASLKYLSCDSNQLFRLDVSKNTALTTLNCSSNQIRSLNVSNNNSLISLNCHTNQLTNLDIPNNNSLTSLSCHFNQLTSLDLSKMTMLDELLCHENQLMHLDVSENTALKTLACRKNNIKILDLSKNTNLVAFDGADNLLNNLNLKNGNNSNFTYFDTRNNSNLTCIQVDDAAWSTSNWTNKDLTASYSENCGFTPLTYIPDDNFEQALIDLSFDNGVLDNYVPTANIDTITVLHLNNKNISNLRGIKDFTSLTNLSCHYNQLTNIDLSENILLEELLCHENLISSLDISRNLALETLVCRKNQITTLDLSINTVLVAFDGADNLLNDLNIKNGNNTNFTYFDIRNNSNLTCIQVDNVSWSTNNWTNKDVTASYTRNCSNDPQTLIPNSNFEQVLIDLGLDDIIDGQIRTSNIDTLTRLDISNVNINDLTGLESFPSLTHLLCQSNQFSVIDLSHFPNLEVLDCSNNLLTSLDLSNNPLLRSVNCSGNNLSNYKTSSLKASPYTTLETMDVSNNNLTSLDVSDYTVLKSLDCSSNLLNSLNVKNGNNINFIYFDAQNNPSLVCIQVDNATYSTLNWTQKDLTANYYEDCGNISLTDLDGDGVNNANDDFPNDPERAFKNYIPATGSGSLAFEDLWPGKGDYDFNDVVVDYRFTSITNAQNYVVDISAQFIVKASGAYYHNGFGFELTKANNGLLSDLDVTGSDLQENYINVDGNGLEENQSHPTIIVFDDIYNSLAHPGSSTGVNTETHSPFVPFDTINILLTPIQNTYKEIDFEIVKWNPFIIINMERGRELHLKDKPPTNLADLSIFGTVEDDSDLGSKRYYVTTNNLPWAIDVPSSFDWPREKVDISWAYLYFKRWAESLGQENKLWYRDNPSNRNESNIYQVP